MYTTKERKRSRFARTPGHKQGGWIQIAAMVGGALLNRMNQKKAQKKAGSMARESSAEQYRWNKKAMQDAIAASNMNQSNPFGSLTYHGTPGQPGYRREVKMNPFDQHRLDSHRKIGSGLLNAVLGGDAVQMPSMQQEQQTPFKVPPMATPPINPGRGYPNLRNVLGGGYMNMAPGGNRWR